MSSARGAHSLRRHIVAVSLSAGALLFLLVGCLILFVSWSFMKSEYEEFLSRCTSDLVGEYAESKGDLKKMRHFFDEDVEEHGADRIFLMITDPHGRNVLDACADKTIQRAMVTRARREHASYRLSKESGIPQTTITDICSGKAELEKCAAGTLYRVAKVLGITVEDILESEAGNYRSAFETFKSNTCHHVKDMGDLDFIVDVLQKDEIRILYQKRWYPEALYLLAMVDYLSRVNEIPLCTKYNDIRSRKLEKPIYSAGVRLSSEVFKTDEPLLKAERDAIPEFKRFNIFESEVRNVV